MDLTTQRSKGRKDSGGDDCSTLTGEHKSEQKLLLQSMFHSIP